MIEEEPQAQAAPISPTLDNYGDEIELREKELADLIERKSKFENLVVGMQKQQTELLCDFKKGFEEIMDSMGSFDKSKAEYHKLKEEFDQKREKLLKSKKEDPELQNIVDSLKEKFNKAKQEYLPVLDTHFKELKV
jgi:chromosome segregation ATPase